MKLTKQLLAKYLEFQLKLNPASKFNSLEHQLLKELENGSRDINLTRLALDENNSIYAVIRLYPFSSKTWLLGELEYVPGIQSTQKLVALELIPESIYIARNFNVEKIETRIKISSVFEEYRGMLKNSGFIFKGPRIEFKSPVEELPGEEGSPLKWIEVDEQKFALSLDILGKCLKNDPDWDQDDSDYRQFVNSLLRQEGLNNSLSCIHLGIYRGVYAAFVFAQVDPSTGWSRIAYMGLIPEYRGKDLGKWVHRHGFQMIREQRGRMYQGGCLAENKPMVSLFKLHKCSEYCRYEEWIWVKSRVDWYIENMFKHNY
ncbi:MAG: hypothetical protein ACP5FK_11695 [bacterium]